MFIIYVYDYDYDYEMIMCIGIINDHYMCHDQNMVVLPSGLPHLRSERQNTVQQEDSHQVLGDLPSNKKKGC